MLPQFLHSLPYPMSDHIPLLLQGELGRKPIGFFCFDFKPIDFKDDDGTYIRMEIT